MSLHLTSPDPEMRASWSRTLSRLPLLAYRALRWRALRGGWLPEYLRRRRFDRRSFAPGQTIDVMVLTADHYEPAKRFGDAAAVESVRSWCAAYEKMARKHGDADGRPPQHTWFYRYDYPNRDCVQALSESVFRGFGEVEFHLHHDHDTHETMAATLRDGVNWFGRCGAMRTAEERPRQLFGYVAGNSALDNGARDDSLSGCDTEISALRDAGCYADFTFPSLGSPAQPRKCNTHYYATEDGRPKSYHNGVDVEVGRAPSGDLLLFQGPITVDWHMGGMEDGALENSSRPHPRRLAGLLAGNVHVTGRPEWIFVKTHTHAMQNRDSFLSADMDAMYEAMETWWNRPPFRLHYVTAREAYNIVKAAEAGCSGDPNDYRDYLIPPPANRVVSCNLPWLLHSYTPERIHVEVLQEGPARLEFAGRPLRSIAGRVREVEAEFHDGELIGLRIEGEGPFEVDCSEGAGMESARAAYAT
ncbi:MAG TPA: hypothetical protein DDY78_24650 [Planctomycetales bacterium]|jgi:hypothetical protein|nr:hypothetical protein [Planctomycetales bacterium]